VANFLEALGDTLLMGNALAGRARAEKRQAELDAENRKMQNLNYAILQQQQEQNAADRLLEAGPGARLTPEQASVVEKGGRGNRLAPAMQDIREVDPNVVLPIQLEVPGSQILPSFEQSRQIEADKRATEMHGLQTGDLRAQAADRTKVQQMRELVSSPTFWNQPAEKRQLIWAQANYSGNAPLSWDEMKDRMSYEHDLEMQKVNAQIAGQRDVASIRGAGADRKRLFDMTQRVQKDLKDETSFASKLKQQFSLMEAGAKAILEGKPNAGGQAVLTTFQKILDPESVVRESEYLRSAEGQALRNQLKGAWERLTVGGTGVAKDVLINEYLAVARDIVETNERYIAAKQAEALADADYFGLPRHLIVPQAAPAGVQAQPGVTNTNPPPGNQSPGAVTPPAGGKFTIIGRQ
jgi:hypothetical protein